MHLKNPKWKHVSYQFLLSGSVFLLSLGQVGFVGLLIGLGGLNPLRRGSVGHCELMRSEEEKKRKELPLKSREEKEKRPKRE